MNTALSTILIIDTRGEIASLLTPQLQEQNVSVVFIGNGGTPLGKIPRIPDASYTHIFVVYSREVERLDIVSQLVQKARLHKAKLIFICKREDELTPDKKIIDAIISGWKESYVAIYGEIFDGILHKIKQAQEIKIAQTGTHKTFPVLQEDIVKWLKIIAFQPQQNKIFFLFPKHPPTGLSIARMIHKVDPLVRIDFNHHAKHTDDTKKAIEEELVGEYVLEDRYPPLASIKKIYHTAENLEMPTPLYKKESSSRRPYLFYAISFVFSLFALPILTMGLFSLVGAHMLGLAKNNINGGDIIAAQKATKYSNMLFTIAQSAGKGVVAEAQLIGKTDAALSHMAAIETGKELSRALEYMLSASLLYKNIVEDKSQGPQEDMKQSIHLAKSAIGIFQKLRAEQETINNKEIKALFNNIESFNTTVDLFANTIDTLPTVLGFDKERLYLILFQNNMELRPGGGFIGSYGLLSMQNGKMKELTVHDVYDADGQLKGHVEPPFPIRRYLPSPHWYLRDSNFDVDFSRGASASAFFLHEETGKTVDGVIGVDISFAEGIIGALGPVYVGDYDETVTKDNVYMLTQSHAEKNFFPGSSQKKDFLRSLFTSLTQHLKEGKNISYISLLKSMDEALTQKHILLTFADARLQSLYGVNGVSSVIRDDRVENKTKINDFLAINEANLGINKANYFLKRKVNQETTIGESSVSARLTIAYTNESTSWPGGDYKNYLRLLVPSGSTLSSIIIDGKKQKITRAERDPAIYEAKKFVPPVELEVEQDQNAGKTTFGFLSIVPASTTKKITISYTFPHRLESEQSFTYSHRVFKQPGTLSDPYTFSLSFPPGFATVLMPKSVSRKEGKLEWKYDLAKDTDLAFYFSKK